ncbi:DHH family phosphoesterase, partial [Candidatus Babeliales bacterium]|nr:DHH family phosphoesterase [Candidatus Babeliales bacterium]
MNKRTFLFILSFVFTGFAQGMMSGESQIFPELSSSVMDAVENVVVLGHWGPDGDCIGSTAAIQFALQELGKNVTVIYPNKPAIDLDFAWQPDNVVYGKYEGVKPDLIISCDASTWGQIVWNKELFNGVPFVVIDHHPRQFNHEELIAGDRVINGKYAGYGVKLAYIDPKASSACEVLYDLFKEWKFEITSEIANALLFGIYSDTNQMKFLSRDSVQAEKTRAAVQALKDECGADGETVSEVFVRGEAKVAGIVESWLEKNNSRDLGCCCDKTAEYWVIEKQVPIKAVLGIVRKIASQGIGLEIRVIVYKNVELGGLQVFLRRAQSSNFDLGALSQSVGKKLNIRGGGQPYAAGIQATSGYLNDKVEDILEEIRRAI